jgi:sulfide:quinone oxidoreductase
MPSRGIEPRRVVVAGAGVAGLEACLGLADLGERRLELTLVAPVDRFTLHPLAVAEPFGGERVPSFSLVDVARDLGARHVLDRLAAVRGDDMAVELESGAELPYDVLLVATGARPGPMHPDVLTFGGRGAVAALRTVIHGLTHGALETVAFVVPRGATWPLPMYELALMTRRRAGRGRVFLVTPEPAPLALFGDGPSRVIGDLLDDAGIELRTGADAVVEAGGRGLLLDPGGPSVAVDRVVALPVLHGPHMPGLPADADGWVRVDEHGRVPGLRRVYAAGDVTDQPIKQGGLAAQQAYAAVRHITAQAGGALGPEPFRPVLRGLLLTGERDRYLRHGRGDADRVSDELLWWPPAKVVGHYLGPWIAAHTHDRRWRTRPSGGTPVERPLPARLDPAILGLDPYGP